MNLLEAIHARRAVRSYSPRPVPDDVVRALLDAAVQAPSAMNTQAWVFGVVQSVDTLKRWSERAKAMILAQADRDPHVAHLGDMLRSPGFNVFYDASTLVVIGAQRRETYTEADCWLAAENLMLAACDAGLATCPIGFALPWLNTAEAKQELRLDPAGVAVAAVIVGYARGEVPPVPRREPSVVAWIR